MQIVKVVVGAVFVAASLLVPVVSAAAAPLSVDHASSIGANTPIANTPSADDTPWG